MGDLSYTQVLIAGGGPVGLLLAGELAARGVDTVLLEQNTEPSERPRATTLHARTVQVLARRGCLLGEDPERAAGAVTAPFHFAGMPGLTVSAPAGEPHPIAKITQLELERLFEARARAAGARILRGHRIVEIVPGPDGVRVESAADGVTHHWAAGHLVGADGARSAVRERCGFLSDTHPPTVAAISGAVRLDEAEPALKGWHSTSRGWIVAKGLPDGSTYLRTLVCDRPPADRSKVPTLEEFAAETSRVAGRTVTLSEPRWLSRFSDFSRLVRTYRQGCVLLAGDAAHQYFPIGGQGLSTGLLDALDLGWKLALTVHGRAGDGLLDSYEQDRRPAAERVIMNTRAQVALMRPDSGLDPVRELMSRLLSSEEGNAGVSAMISAQDTTTSPVGGCAPGDGHGATHGGFLPNLTLRTPGGPTSVTELLCEGRSLLLVRGPEGERLAHRADGWEDAVRVVRCLPDGTAAAACPSAVFVRPDGYIGWSLTGGTGNGPGDAVHPDGDGAAEGVDGPVGDGESLEAVLTAYFGASRVRQIR